MIGQVRALIEGLIATTGERYKMSVHDLITIVIGASTLLTQDRGRWDVAILIYILVAYIFRAS